MKLEQIYGLFYKNKDIESGSGDIEIGVSGPICSQKNFRVTMGQQYPYSTRWDQNIVSINHIYGARDISLLFCDHQDTEFE